MQNRYVFSVRKGKIELLNTPVSFNQINSFLNLWTKAGCSVICKGKEFN